MNIGVVTILKRSRALKNVLCALQIIYQRRSPEEMYKLVTLGQLPYLPFRYAKSCETVARVAAKPDRCDSSWSSVVAL